MGRPSKAEQAAKKAVEAAAFQQRIARSLLVQTPQKRKAAEEARRDFHRRKYARSKELRELHRQEEIVERAEEFLTWERRKQREAELAEERREAIARSEREKWLYQIHTYPSVEEVDVEEARAEMVNWLAAREDDRQWWNESKAELAEALAEQDAKEQYWREVRAARKAKEQAAWEAEKARRAKLRKARTAKRRVRRKK
jgi:hypothetical protein